LKIEKEAIQASNSPFIVKLAATFSREQTVYLLREAAMGGDLYTVYRRQRLWGSEVHARFYTACVALKPVFAAGDSEKSSSGAWCCPSSRRQRWCPGQHRGRKRTGRDPEEYATASVLPP
jgi:hypothetical protein